MRSDEIRASGQLATRTLTDTVSHVEQVHRAVSGRTFAFAAPVSLPARVIHDVIATGVYAAIRGVGLAAGMAASELVGGAAGSALPVGSTPQSNLAFNTANARLLWGVDPAGSADPAAAPTSSLAAVPAARPTPRIAAYTAVAMPSWTTRTGKLAGAVKANALAATA